jgi:hypothetical protein
MITRTFITGIAALFLATGTAHSDAATQQRPDATHWALKQYDDSMLSDSEFHYYIENFLKGMATGLMWANASLKVKNQPPFYCQPDHLYITGPMVIDMIRRGIRENPDWGEEPFNYVAFLALKRTFPCKPQ